MLTQQLNNLRPGGSWGNSSGNDRQSFGERMDGEHRMRLYLDFSLTRPSGAPNITWEYGSEVDGTVIGHMSCEWICI